jgi:hypothetical protein
MQEIIPASHCSLKIKCIFENQQATNLSGLINLGNGNFCFPKDIVFSNISGKNYVAKASNTPRNYLLAGIITVVAFVVLSRLLKPSAIKV